MALFGLNKGKEREVFGEIVEKFKTIPPERWEVLLGLLEYYISVELEANGVIPDEGELAIAFNIAPLKDTSIEA